MYFRAASLDLKDFPRKIEKRDIERFAAAIKKQNVDILTVQNIVNYPTIKDRINIDEEIRKKTGTYNVFGEAGGGSGRVIGNAVYSTYPIRSNDNLPYKKLKSIGLEAAQFAYIDAGTRPVYIVSTRVPEKVTDAEVMSCMKELITQKRNYQETPIAIFGNILKPANMQIVEDLQEPLEYNVVTYEQGGVSRKIPFWFSSGDLQVMSSNVISTDLGLTLVVEFKLLGQKPK